MSELRPHVPKQGFVERIKSLQRTDKYQLAYIAISCKGDDADADEQQQQGAAAAVLAVVAVAGFAIMNNLASGRHVYVYDLVTSLKQRSAGYGRQMMDYLKQYASDNRCGQLHLDSGVQRLDAHRFYEREGLPITAYHFSTTNLNK